MKKTMIAVVLAVASVTVHADPVASATAGTMAPVKDRQAHCVYIANMLQADVQARDSGLSLDARMTEASKLATDRGEDVGFARERVADVYTAPYWATEHDPAKVNEEALKVCMARIAKRALP